MPDAASGSCSRSLTSFLSWRSDLPGAWPGAQRISPRAVVHPLTAYKLPPQRAGSKPYDGVHQASSTARPTMCSTCCGRRRVPRAPLLVVISVYKSVRPGRARTAGHRPPASRSWTARAASRPPPAPPPAAKTGPAVKQRGTPPRCNFCNFKGAACGRQGAVTCGERAPLRLPHGRPR